MESSFERFTLLILTISRQIQRLKSSEMSKVGLKGVHASVLFLLRGNQEGLTQAELTRMSGEDKATISRAVGSLQERGLVVSSQADRSKKYNDRLLLTESGSALANHVSDEVNAVLQAGGDALSPMEREMMYSSLEKVTACLDAFISEKQTKKQ